jgi:hypothetical protein
MLLLGREFVVWWPAITNVRCRCSRDFVGSYLYNVALSPLGDGEDRAKRVVEFAIFIRLV